MNSYKKKLEYMDWEFGIFFHFGLRAFFPGHDDWEGKDMPLEAFNPKELDCESWIKTAKTYGIKVHLWMQVFYSSSGWKNPVSGLNTLR